MRRKIVSGILVSVLIISKIFVIVNAANINETNIMQNTNNANKANTVQELNKESQKTNKTSNDVSQSINEIAENTLNTVNSEGNTTVGAVEHAQNPQKSETNTVEKEEYISEDDLIYSNKYLVKGKVVSRIEPKTSIEEFKKNIEIAKEQEIKIYKGKEEITSGYIGTGMVVKGANGEEYELSVIGDISRRRNSKPNRTNNNNPTSNKLKRMGTKRNRKRIKRHKPETGK